MMDCQMQKITTVIVIPYGYNIQYDYILYDYIPYDYMGPRKSVQ